MPIEQENGDRHLRVKDLNYAIFAGRLVIDPVIATEAAGVIAVTFMLKNDLATVACTARGRPAEILAQRTAGEVLIVAGQLITKDLNRAQQAQALLLCCETARRLKLTR